MDWNVILLSITFDVYNPKTYQYSYNYTLHFFYLVL